MVPSILPEEEKRLAERLRGEAKESQPDFSESLDARIRAAIRRPEPAVGLPAPRRGPPRRRMLLATAASLALCASLAVWQARDWLSGSRPERPGARAQDDALAELDALASVSDRTAVDFGAAVDSALKRRQWAYLDQDAHAAARLLLDIVPLNMLASGKRPES